MFVDVVFANFFNQCLFISHFARWKSSGVAYPIAVPFVIGNKIMPCSIERVNESTTFEPSLRPCFGRTYFRYAAEYEPIGEPSDARPSTCMRLRICASKVVACNRVILSMSIDDISKSTLFTTTSIFVSIRNIARQITGSRNTMMSLISGWFSQLKHDES